MTRRSLLAGTVAPLFASASCRPGIVSGGG